MIKQLTQQKYLPLPMCTLRFSLAILGVRAKLLEDLTLQLNPCVLKPGRRHSEKSYE